MKPKASYDVSAEKFVETWQQSDSADEVAEKLSMPKPIVLARASGYRKIGIKIKKMKKKSPVIDVERLNKLIEKLETEKVDQQ
jgi:hypothetical protein